MNFFTVTGLLAILFVVLKTAVVVVIGFLCAKIAAGFLTKLLSKTNIDISLVRFLTRCAKIAIIVFTVIAALSLLGIPTTGLIAGVSAVAAAIALALQGSLSNIAGGIFILMTRPFVTGNLIDANGVLGTVKDIQLIHTIICTPDNKEVIIPNSVIVNSTITNLSNSETRRVDLVFSISYENDARLAEKIILETALSHTYTLTEPAPFVRVSAHSANSIDITCRIWVKADDYWTVYFDMLELVRDEFNKNGITIPYNQLDVHIDQQ